MELTVASKNLIWWIDIIYPNVARASRHGNQPSSWSNVAVEQEGRTFGDFEVLNRDKS